MTPNLHGLAARLDRLEQRLERIETGAVEFTTLAHTTASGADDQANFAGNPPDTQRPVRRVAPWGVSGHPMPGVFSAIMKALGGAFNGLVVGVASDTYGPQDLKEGETCLWNKGAARVLLDENDNVVHSGKAVQLNGADHPLPKWDSAEVDLAAALKAILTAITTACVNGKPLYVVSPGEPIESLITNLGNGTYESLTVANG